MEKETTKNSIWVTKRKDDFAKRILGECERYDIWHTPSMKIKAEKYISETLQKMYEYGVRTGIEEYRGVGMGNVYRTKEEAELHRLRLESMAQRGEMPERNTDIWFWSFEHNRPFSSREVEHPPCYIPYWWIGCTKKTREEVQEWADKYLEAWKV